MTSGGGGLNNGSGLEVEFQPSITRPFSVNYVIKVAGIDATNGNETHFSVGCSLRAIEWAVIMGSDSVSLKFLIASTVRPPGWVTPSPAGFGKPFGRLPRRMPFLEAAREST